MKYFYRAIALWGFVTVLGGISPAISTQNSPILIVQNSAEDLFNSALAKSEAGDIQGAIADYTEAIRLNPDYAAAHNKRGIIRARDLKDYPAAKADFDRAIQIDPNYGDAYYNRARVREFLEDINGAIADYHTAAQFYQKSGKTNDYQDAIKHLQLLEQ
ncbi:MULTISPECIES: tetratricopeptide repeat protein [Microcoleaceae]|uniref:tetratricopeptide repeat protein n=1 Tax=Microcoleaceae TaxID=1892252 RepID=UPI00187F141C|nr:tetratricopeptide repeat protein [Tychonema sp. LEGE 06208]MBE9164551.1 tetratricopeptide repeat protein [Tychonema sp. LEGE 06208]